jgi:hypothetical protein
VGDSRRHERTLERNERENTKRPKRAGPERSQSRDWLRGMWRKHLWRSLSSTVAQSVNVPSWLVFINSLSPLQICFCSRSRRQQNYTLDFVLHRLYSLPSVLIRVQLLLEHTEVENNEDGKFNIAARFPHVLSGPLTYNKKCDSPVRRVFAWRYRLAWPNNLVLLLTF